MTHCKSVLREKKDFYMRESSAQVFLTDDRGVDNLRKTIGRACSSDKCVFIDFVNGQSFLTDLTRIYKVFAENYEQTLQEVLVLAVCRFGFAMSTTLNTPFCGKPCQT